MKISKIFVDEGAELVFLIKTFDNNVLRETPVLRLPQTAMDLKETPRKNMSRCFFLAAVGVFLVFGVVWAMPDITVTGNWSLTIDETNLQGGAGSDLTSLYESANNEVTIDISGLLLPTDPWRVDVKKTDTNWSGDFQIFVKRTGDGTGDLGSSITGGTAYQEVTNTDQTFFSGEGNRSDIPIQLKLDNVSVAIQADTYTTMIIYTVVET